MLMKAVESYLALRRAAGYELKNQEYRLKNFARFAAECGDNFVSIPTVMKWASQIDSPHYRLETVIPFARHVQAEDERHQVPSSKAFGNRRARRIPFIFTPSESNLLVEEATHLEPIESLRPHTYSTLFGLLFASGLRISESLNLLIDDCTRDGLLIRRTKFQKSRLVPLHETAVAGVERYLERRKRTASGDDHLFVSLRGRGLSQNAVFNTFDELRRKIGLDRGRGGRRPRVHDIRHTFAVRALEACPEGRDNVGRHMLALSTYMGHSHINHTYWYLDATPHLMRDIVEACEAFLKRGDS